MNTYVKSALKIGAITGALLAGIIGPAKAQPASKNVFLAYPSGGLNTPIGIAYSPNANKLLVTQPFCGTVSLTNSANATGFSVQAIDPNGNVSLFANLPDVQLSSDVPVDFGHSSPPYNQCFEQYIAVSPGTGGFPAGDVYVTQGQRVVHLPAAGGSSSIFVSGLATKDTESGITFDTVGSFCNDMIITGSNGNIYLVDSTGNATLYVTMPSSPALGSNAVAAETVAVAPLSFAPYGGWLMVGAEDNPAGSVVAAVQPPSSCSPLTIPGGGNPQVYNVSMQPGGPEAVAAIPSSATSCTFGHVSGGSMVGGTMFAVTYTSGVVIPSSSNAYQIVAYPASNFTSIVGNVIVSDEDLPTNYLSSNGGGLGSTVNSNTFDAVTSGTKYVQQEGLTFTGCPVPPPNTTNSNGGIGCVLTPGGYKNHFNYKVTSLVIGGHLYTASDVSKIEGTTAGGIDALGRSLAAALLNQNYGAFVPGPVQDAIDQAQTAMFNVTTAVGKTIFTATATPANASALNTILDAYNNGLAPNGPTQECTK